MRYTIILLFMLLGCAAQGDTLERQLQHSIDAENWAICKIIYDRSNRPTVSTHRHGRGQPHSTQNVRDDLSDNSCRIILGKYWITQ